MRGAVNFFGLLGLLGLASCGGGGGGGSTPVQTVTRLLVPDIEFAAGAASAELIVQLADLPSPGPPLLQIAVELPAALTIASTDALQPLQSVPTLRGELAGNRYLIVCGDDHNAQGQRLANGPVFRLRLLPTQPRQPGLYEVRLVDLRIAQNDGSAVSASAAPAIARVTVR